MKKFVLIFVSLFASAAMASGPSSKEYTCKSAKAGLIIQTIPQTWSIQVYNLKGQLVKNYPNVIPSYSYNGALNPMIIEVKLTHGESGKNVLTITGQKGQKMTGIYFNDHSFTCTAR